MQNKARAVFAILIGIIFGAAINMSLIIIGSALIPAPEGVNPQDMDSLAANMDLFEAKHFLFPFLAHALGTLVAALTAYAIATTRRKAFAWVMGVFFLLGGLYASSVIPAPAWFKVVDLLFAYIPMAWLAIFIMNRLGIGDRRPAVVDHDSTGEV